ncbi:IS66 family transposase [Psychroflexus sp. MBR-150]|jgi:transposase
MTYQELLKKNEENSIFIKNLKAKNASLQAQLDQLVKLINGFKSERFVSNEVSNEQFNLFSDTNQEIEASEEEPSQTITYNRKKKKHHGRNKLPEHLPVKEVIIEPKEDTEDLVKIGEEVSETLEYTPASLIKRRTIRPKYANKSKDKIIIGELPTRPIPKSIVEASLLAYILTAKFVDHLPLYRQIQRFKREFGWEVAQSTMCDWVDSCCQLLDPLYNTLKQKILESDYIQADESPIKVLDKDKKGSTHQGYQWVYRNPLQGLVLFNYHKGRGQHGSKEILLNYQGYLQCDGYQVYDKIGQQQGITLVGCLAHARRKFFDAKDNDSTIVNKILEQIQKIYLEEREIKKIAKEDLALKQKLREEKIAPKLEQIKTWIEAQSIKVLPKSAVGKAMSYYLNQYPKIKAITLDPRLELDNNLIENAIRPLALGRKNYLFAGSHKGAQNIAIMYSLFASCKINNVNPQEWLRDVLEKIPDYNIQKLEELLPNNWIQNHK